MPSTSILVPETTNTERDSETNQSSQSFIMRKPGFGLGKGYQLIYSETNDRNEDIIAHGLVLTLKFCLQSPKSRRIEAYALSHQLVLFVDLGKIDRS